MVPSTRLLWITGLVVLPAATLIGAAPGLSSICALVLAVVMAVAVADAVMARRRLDGLTADAPEIIHATQGRDFDLTVDVRGARSPLRLGLQWPDAFRAPEPIQRLDPRATTAIWPLRALRRGAYSFNRIFIETGSPLGLWARRSSLPLAIAIRVYPDLRRDRRGLAAVYFNRGGPGVHTRPQIGKGREFDHLRTYAAGDDFGDIHWKSTARRGTPVTKTFQIERTREVYVVIDHSRLSARTTRMPADGSEGSGESDGLDDSYSQGGEFEVTTQLERCLQSALVLGLAAQKEHDLFGLVTFADQVTKFHRSGAGQAHYNSCRDVLYTLEPRQTAPNFEELFIFLRKTLTRRALLVILTDLSDPLQAESFCESVKLLSRQHLVLVSMVRPEDAHPLFAGPSVEAPDDIYRALGGHFLWHDLQEVGQVLRQRGVHLSLPDSAALSADLVSQYMSVKRRQAL